MLSPANEIFNSGLLKKGRHLAQSCDKDPFIVTNNKSQETTQDATKIFDINTIANRVKPVSWCYYCHPNGVVKPVNGIGTFPLTSRVV